MSIWDMYDNSDGEWDPNENVESCEKKGERHDWKDFRTYKTCKKCGYYISNEVKEYGGKWKNLG